MARLRRNSSESLGSRDGPQSAHPDTTKGDQSIAAQKLGEPQAKATRSSPRKKPVKSYRLSISSCDGELASLVPKAAPAGKPRSKQIRLAPLGTVKQSARPPVALDFLPAPPRSRRSPANALSPSKATSATRPIATAIPPESSTNDVVEVEADIEESVWCGSDRASDTSGDELPSPSKFMHEPARRLFPSATAESAGIDLARGIDALRISESHPRALPGLPPSSDIHDGSCPRPTSSSDQENAERALLRFSPPRLHSPRKQQTPERAVTPPPTSPSKGRLLSPSKRVARVPTPPFRPSLDAFWNAETVNDWHDQYSPRKEWKSPRKLKLLGDDASTSPTASPRKAQSPSKRTKAEVEAKKDWESRKHRIAEDFLAELDCAITDGKVGELANSTGGVRFTWSKTLNSTAGRANWRRETTKTRHADGTTSVAHKHHASIELAEKVIDDEDRLLNVIAHEFCHLCNFMVSGIKDQPHGRQFKEWGSRCTKAFSDRGIEVTTKHTYQIEYKYIWRCSNEDCAAEFKRHSKSIDLKRHSCGSCRGQLVQVKPVPRQGAGGGATGYAAYVKQHFASIKSAMPGATQKHVMEAVGRQYRAEKAALASVDALGKAAGGCDDSVSAIGEVEKVARVLEFITLDDE
ncbi:hypothetical protein LTR08_005710 [Meristemomyces frigidus]|nr:hypothetical protein LTR08_005710 [Meristemomyces frigidus]